MNNHKWIGILLCIVPLFVPIYATVPYNETSFHIFPKNLRDLEQTIFDSLQITKNIFAQPELVAGTLTKSEFATFAPILKQISALRALLAHKSDWKKAFMNSIAYCETTRIKRSFTDNIEWMETTMRSIEPRFQLMYENNTAMSNRKTVASIFRKDIERMINFFDNSESPFRKYPLLAVPPLTALALLIILFDPIAQSLIPMEAKSPDFSCKMMQILLDYRPRAVNERLEELSLHSSKYVWWAGKLSWRISLGVIDAMSLPYNQYGYNKTIPGTIYCDKYVDTRKIKVYSKNDKTDPKFFMKDAFGVDKYMANPICTRDYSLLLRHRVEEMFQEVDTLNGLCVNPSQPTGFGWLTIKLKDLQAHGTSEGEYCDGPTYGRCDPYVMLYIDDKLQKHTSFRLNECCYDVNRTIISEKITKNSRIKIEVWDANMFKDQLVLTTEGNVDSFLTNGHRRGVMVEGFMNYINTVSFWQDKYK